MTRTFEAPGTYTNEIDRSNYERTQDYSIVGTTVLACGYADKGNDYVPEWINTMKTFEDVYGTPTNEAETYFYNAAAEMIGQGGVFVGMKLPYSNLMNGNYKFVDYVIDNNLKNISDDVVLSSEIAYSKANVLKYLQLSCDDAAMITMKKFDELITNEAQVEKNTIRIVDVTHSKYLKLKNVNLNIVLSTIELEDGTLTTVKTNDCLGIVPVIVTPFNAMYVQNLFQRESISSFNAISSIALTKSQNRDNIPLSALFKELDDSTKVIDLAERVNDIIEKAELNDIELLDIDSTSVVDIKRKTIEIAEHAKIKEDPTTAGEIRDILNECIDVLKTKKALNYVDVEALNSLLSIKMKSDDLDELTFSQIVAGLFPNILYESNGNVSMKYMNSIGVLVFQAYQDQLNDGRISFRLLENFVGSLDRTAIDEEGKSIFIDDIVNSGSATIKLFSNADKSLLQQADTLFIRDLIVKALGFYQIEAAKTLERDSVALSLKTALKKCENPDMLPLDIVIDAGITNIAQLAYTFYTINQHSEVNFDMLPRVRDYKLGLSDRNDVKEWGNVLKMFNNFCQNTRKDCMFINDGPRAMCLNGDEKLVRDTDLGSSVLNKIIPRMRLTSSNAVNSSYTACYCNWFKVLDAYNRQYFWIPPSIKAASSYVYTDAYFHTWDAPAGIIRGKLNNVVDTAFTPNKNEAGLIYSQGFNYAMNYPLDGIVLEGQKTMQLRKTAFDRVNVRRLFLRLEKQISRLGKYFLYQGNTLFNRQRFTDQIRVILEGAVNGGGISEYAIKCDDANNPPEVIDRNELHCRIAVKPIKSIEFIVLDFICSSQSADVTEEVVK